MADVGLNLELRLALDTARQQVKKFAGEVSKELGAATKGSRTGGGGFKQSADGLREYERAAISLTRKLGGLSDAQRRMATQLRDAFLNVAGSGREVSRIQAIEEIRQQMQGLTTLVENEANAVKIAEQQKQDAIRRTKEIIQTVRTQHDRNVKAADKDAQRLVREEKAQQKEIQKTVDARRVADQAILESITKLEAARRSATTARGKAQATSAINNLRTDLGQENRFIGSAAQVKAYTRERLAGIRAVEDAHAKSNQKIQSLDDLAARARGVLESRSVVLSETFEQQRVEAVAHAQAMIEKIIANSSGQSLAQITANVQKEMGVYLRREQQLRQMNAQSLRDQGHGFAVGGRSVSGLFQVQQAIEDYEFAGIRGAANNLALLASMMGGPAGLAALGGLAAASLYRMSNSMKDAEESAKRAAKGFGELMDMQRQMAEFGKESSVKTRTGGWVDDMKNQEEQLRNLRVQIEETAALQGKYAKQAAPLNRALGFQREIDSLEGWFDDTANTTSVGMRETLARIRTIKEELARLNQESGVPLERRGALGKFLMNQLFDDAVNVQAVQQQLDELAQSSQAAGIEVAKLKAQLTAVERSQTLFKPFVDGLDAMRKQTEAVLRDIGNKFEAGNSTIGDAFSDSFDKVKEGLAAARISALLNDLKSELDTLDAKAGTTGLSAEETERQAVLLKLIAQEQDRITEAVAATEKALTAEHRARAGILSILTEAVRANERQQDVLRQSISDTQELVRAEIQRREAIQDTARAQRQAYEDARFAVRGQVRGLEFDAQEEGTRQSFENRRKRLDEMKRYYEAQFNMAQQQNRMGTLMRRARTGGRGMQATNFVPAQISGLRSAMEREYQAILQHLEANEKQSLENIGRNRSKAEQDSFREYEGFLRRRADAENDVIERGSRAGASQGEQREAEAALERRRQSLLDLQNFIRQQIGSGYDARERAQLARQAETRFNTLQGEISGVSEREMALSRAREASERTRLIGLQAQLDAAKAAGEALAGLTLVNEATVASATALRGQMETAATAAERFQAALQGAAAAATALGAQQLGDFNASQLPGRAVGGPVSRNGMYLVGERGPELFSPQASGHIFSNANTRAFLDRALATQGNRGSSSSSSVSRSSSVHFGNITIAGTGDVEGASRAMQDFVIRQNLTRFRSA